VRTDPCCEFRYLNVESQLLIQKRPRCLNASRLCCAYCIRPIFFQLRRRRLFVGINSPGKCCDCKQNANCSAEGLNSTFLYAGHFRSITFWLFWLSKSGGDLRSIWGHNLFIVGRVAGCSGACHGKRGFIEIAEPLGNRRAKILRGLRRGAPVRSAFGIALFLPIPPKRVSFSVALTNSEERPPGCKITAGRC